MVKTLINENVFEDNNIDQNYYNSERIYKLIKKNNISFAQLSKDTIIDVILKNNLNKGETILGKKTLSNQN
jgi:hypothetical protein